MDVHVCMHVRWACTHKLHTKQISITHLCILCTALPEYSWYWTVPFTVNLFLLSLQWCLKSVTSISSEAWGAFWTWTGQSITALIAWRKEELKMKAADVPPSEVGHDLCLTRQTLALFWGATVGRLLRDGAERIWAFPSATMLSWAETETETELKSNKVWHCCKD